MRRKSKPKPAKPEMRKPLPPLDDEVPEDIDEFCNRLARRIAMIVSTWQGCPERACRRHRRCLAPNTKCINAPPLNISKEEGERRIANFYKALQARAAELGET